MRILAITLTACLLSACSIFTPYKPDIQQGNVINSDMTAKLHIGMSPAEVVKAMGGEPVMRNTFANNTYTYVYTFKPGKGKMIKKKVTLTFKNNKLAEID